MIEKGHIKPGELIIGQDSHTPIYGAFGAFATGVGGIEMANVFATGELWLKVPEVIKLNIIGELSERVMSKDLMLHIIGEHGINFALYKILEFSGQTVEKMSVSSRLAMSSMVVEIGAKAGLFEPDEKVLSLTAPNDIFKPIKSDPTAEYHEIYEVNASEVGPQIAGPNDLQNIKSISEVEGMNVDQVFLGSCANGRLEDLAVAAKILKNQRVHSGTRMIIVPASQQILTRALRNGFIEIFVKAGAIVCNPSCGPCAGRHLGILGPGDVCLSTAPRNSPKGRMGSPEAKVYLVSPATAAASAIKGVITDPRTL
jgi:3-isopropylmalate/(R)-2-methylmalate dehydratase large subunit